MNLREDDVGGEAVTGVEARHCDGLVVCEKGGLKMREVRELLMNWKKWVGDWFKYVRERRRREDGWREEPVAG